MIRSGLVLGAALAVGVAGSCAYLFNALQVERMTTSELRQRVEALEGSINAQRSRVTRVPPLPSIPTSAPVDPPPAAASRLKQPSIQTCSDTASSAPEDAPPIATRTSRADRERELLANPEYRAARRQQERVAVQSSYIDLGSALSLPPEQTERLFELLTEQRMRSIAGRLTPASPEERQLRRQKQDEEITALIGGIGLMKFNDYLASMPERGAVRRLSMRLSSNGQALNSDQVENVVSALRSGQAASGSQPSTQARGTNGAAVIPNRQPRLDLLSTRNSEAQEERLREAIRPYLSPQQLTEYERLLDGTRQLRQANERMREAVRTLTPGGATNLAPNNVRQR